MLKPSGKATLKRAVLSETSSVTLAEARCKEEPAEAG